jgi:CxC ATPase-based modification system component
VSIDSRIKNAIIDAVKEAQQTSSLADKLIAWFEALATENESLDDRESVSRHLEILYQVTEVEIEDNEGSGDQAWQ